MRGSWLAVLVGAIVPMILFSWVSADDLTQMGAKELEERVLESRRALKSGEFHIRVAGETQTEAEFHTWLGTSGNMR